jgi:hypothetical protein
LFVAAWPPDKHACSGEWVSDMRHAFLEIVFELILKTIRHHDPSNFLPQDGVKFERQHPKCVSHKLRECVLVNGWGPGDIKFAFKETACTTIDFNHIGTPVGLINVFHVRHTHSYF